LCHDTHIFGGIISIGVDGGGCKIPTEFIPGMTKKTVQSAQAPRPIGPYSQAVSAGGFLFCSGQIPLDPATGDLVSGNAGAQTRRVLENLRAVLEAGKSGLSGVVKVTVFLADLADFGEVNRVFEEYFPASPPARAVVQAAALPKGARIEIECIAVEAPVSLPKKAKGGKR
jgi:2-iminobutanoate/2-iminopropanoate deaminase